MKYKKYLLLLICVSFFVVNISVAFASDYYVFSGKMPGGDKYKGIPEAWWASWYIKEFDKYANAPGSDWTENLNNPSDQREWLESARKNGWKTCSIASEPKVGAIGISIQPGTMRGGCFVKLFIVEKITDDGVYIKRLQKTESGSDVVSYFETFKQIRVDDLDKNFIFKGYIYPEKK